MVARSCVETRNSDHTLYETLLFEQNWTTNISCTRGGSALHSVTNLDFFKNRLMVQIVSPAFLISIQQHFHELRSRSFWILTDQTQANGGSKLRRMTPERFVFARLESGFLGLEGSVNFVH